MIERHVPEGPCLLLDKRLNVVHVAPAAQRWLGESEAVLALHQQRLQAPGDPQTLERALATAARGGRAAMALARPGRLALTLRTERLTALGHDWVLVTLRDPELEVPDPALLRGLFGLTRTEALVAAGLARGLDTAELATELRVRPNTVLSHVKRALLKSGTRRQSQLVALILRSAAMPPHPWLAGDAPPPAPGPAQTGGDGSPAAGQSRPPSEPQACARPPAAQDFAVIP